MYQKFPKFRHCLDGGGSDPCLDFFEGFVHMQPNLGNAWILGTFGTSTPPLYLTFAQGDPEVCRHCTNRSDPQDPR